MTWLPHTVITGPATEPVSLAEAKTQCRVTSSAEDSLLTDLISAARDAIEDYCGAKFAEQTIRQDCSCWSDLAAVPFGPVSNAVVTYLDADGVSQTLASTVYRETTTGRSAHFSLKKGQAWPSVFDTADAISVQGIVGETTPERVKHAMLLAISAWFDDRESAALPDAAMSLVANLRRT